MDRTTEEDMMEDKIKNVNVEPDADKLAFVLAIGKAISESIQQGERHGTVRVTVEGDE